MTTFKKMMSIGLVGCVAASSMMMGAGATDMSAQYAKRA